MAVKRSGWKWPAIMVAGLAVVGGVVWHLEHGAPAARFQTATVARGDVTQAVIATGTLNPVLNVAVGCQVSGRIRALYADFNSMVHSNELVAELDPQKYQASVDEAQANVANARANLELQQVQVRRDAQLFTNRLIAQADFDTARATLDEAQASVEIQEAALSNALADLSYCKIYSPIDGIVISRSVNVGQTVAASLSAPTLFEIANDLTRMQIDSAVSEADIGSVKVGQPVTFQVDAYPNLTFRGAVVQVRNSPTNVNNVVTYDCVIGVTNSDLKLKPGMTATVSIISAERRNALLIPNSALRFQPPDGTVAMTGGKSASSAANAPAGPGQAAKPRGSRLERKKTLRPMRTVYVLVGNTANDGRLQPVQIETGIAGDINVEVVKGLREGQRVVTGVLLSQGIQAPAFGRRGGFFMR
ncbi:MAG: efflux RND transporter periplasmic adaptor subunit [Verrucomicrobia bacterium]|nr:efflux RND transporter periplasmic adaptor subunit [Verrucomicrobiota bacterium]MDE3098688.1 efflux RND transporter periplasmic adaptor subunit [Verrucomicrobiota bacterium]